MEKFLYAPKITSGKLEVYKMYQKGNLWYALVWDMKDKLWRDVLLSKAEPFYEKNS